MSVQVSFEFFPPKTPAMEDKLWEAVQKLAPLKPQFVSVTYGAGGSTRERTHATVHRILKETALAPAAHLTCVAASRSEIDGVAKDYWNTGVRHVVALRGDMPIEPGANTAACYAPHPDGYPYAVDLVAGLSRLAPFEISVAAYPEKHPEASDHSADLDSLKRKIDAGATRAITQFFFDPAVYLRFLEKARAAGITVPIVPGILPVTNYAQVQKFAAACGASVPSSMADTFEGLDADPETRKLVAATKAAELCSELCRNGVSEFHFYTLNRADLVMAICHMLGVRASAQVAA